MNIIGTRKIWFAFSGMLIGVSIIAMALWQFKLGIDFTGGTLLQYQFGGARPSTSEVARVVSEAAGESPSSVQETPEGLVLVRLPPIDDASRAKISSAMAEKLRGEEASFEAIGPTVGKELRNKAITSLIIIFIGIVIYIAIAFKRVSRPVRSWVYGIITLLTAFHDVILPMGLFAILGHYLNVDIGSAFVAAILTILGYSINDTIVVLDRVRENLVRTDGTFEQIVERSVHQSLARSLNTTITTLLALVAIYLFGGETLRYLSLALIVGIATGAYSSIFIAAPLLVVWERRKAQK